MAGLNLKLHILLNIILSIFIICSPASKSFSTKSFLKCFSSHLKHNSKKVPIISEIILTKNSSSYSPVLQSSIRNKRFLKTPSRLKPEIILTPFHESHVQAAVVCSTQNDIQIRVRSGGHDYEGLSYISDHFSPFVIIDLNNFRSIKVDIEKEVAFVQAGASVGELYYKIAEKSGVHGFPAGSCPTVGVGGQFSGGGFGTIFRKYGLAADNIIDAIIVNVKGEILDRKSMGEDLFWAIRGGGGSSFGVVLSWKVKLVRVPPTVSIFHIQKTLEEGATKLFHKWQRTANHIHEDLFLHATTGVASTNEINRKTIKVSFTSLFLGTAQKLVPLMEESFPELGLEISNCTEMSWIQSVLYFAGFSTDDPLEVLLNRNMTADFFKAKSDYVKEAISEASLEVIWKRHIEDEGSVLIWTPYGGRMSEISDSEIAFPHRNGNLYGIQYLVSWSEDNETANHIGWMRRFYSYMEAYVSKSPRAAYLNYRDIDIGKNDIGNTSYSKASTWGVKYFKHNFKRLVSVKTKVDPCNFFRNEQSIPVMES